uniref:Interferon alpha inducible protein 27 like 1 n=1 Tax=Aotus nancymaae TaxID=37293 RepID=A0A2K5CS12_AOTNA
MGKSGWGSGRAAVAAGQLDSMTSGVILSSAGSALGAWLGSFRTLS